MLQRHQQRGFNLVEISIIVAVVGVIIGAVIIPVGSLMSDDAYKLEKVRMAEISRAIVGYAVTHRTTEREVVLADDGRTYNLAANRPYLPCPDVTGDGYEDRSNFGVLGIAIINVPSLTITGTLAVDNDLVKIGSCATQRGLLPWRTLGLLAHDVWGNRYTYQVDGVFADALFGFNQNSIVDAFDPRLLADANNYGKRVAAAPYVINVAGVDYTHRNEAAVICNGLNSQCPNNIAVSLTLIAGKIAQSGVSAAPLRDYTAGDVVDGVPFVVVSHGKNGRGAINHLSNIANSDIRCNAPINNTSPFSVPDDFQQEASNTTFPHDPNGDCPVLTINGVRADANLPHFISRPNSRDGDQIGDFDDIVIWKTRRELIDALAGNAALPAPDMPLLRPY